MASKTEPISGRKVMLTILAANRSRGGMPTRELIEQTLAYPGVLLKGATPKATLHAQLVSMQRKGEITKPARGVVKITAQGREVVR